MKHIRQLVRCLVLSSTLVPAPCFAAEAATPSSQALPPFEEVFSLIHSNLIGADPASLNRAAVLGLVQQLHPKVLLVTNHTAQAEAGLVSKTEVYENHFGYLRVAQVESGLAAALERSLQQLRATNKLQGLILDLRFADGQDYTAAAQTADRFVTGEKILMKAGDTVFRSEKKTNAFGLAVATLINPQTSAAAEALAAMMRQADAGILIGAATAGEPLLYKEFTLPTGQKLRIAHAAFQSDSGLSEGRGIVPDITVRVVPKDEQVYFADPYKEIPQLSLTSTAGPAPSTTNSPRRRINEAELVRMQREGLNIDAAVAAQGNAPDKEPALQDPALARALDFLKGLAVVQNRR